MRIFSSVIFVVLVAAFSSPVLADDFVSTVEENFPYHEVDQSIGVASIREGRCVQGMPFSISERQSRSGKNIDVASRIHEKLRALGANAFVITQMKEDTRVRSVTVTPYTCRLS